jgi:hypothetical protein
MWTDLRKLKIAANVYKGCRAIDRETDREIDKDA